MPGKNRICIYVHTHYNSHWRLGIVKKHYWCNNTHN